MYFQKLQTRLIFIFVSFVIVILLISGWMLQWAIRQNLEAELGNKLTAVAGAASVQFDEEEIGYLIQAIGPRTHGYLSEKLLLLKHAAGVERIYFFDSEGKSLIDTDSEISRGDIYFNLRFYPNEIETVKSGKTAHTVLFHSAEGKPVMSGFAPLKLTGAVIGGVGVDGSVPFLGAVRTLRKRLLWIGVSGSMLAIILGMVFAGTISRPVSRLAHSSKRIGMGDYDKPISPQGRGEIGFLAQTLEEMRKNIIEREKELKAMVAGIAHEIRNPIGGIELFTGLLDDETKSNPKAQSHVRRIANEVRYLKEIVNRFLEFARPKNPQKEAVDLGNVIDEVESLLADQIENQKIRIIRSDNINKTILFADPGHLKEIVLNLVQNAVQAQPDGGEIRFEAVEEQNTITLRIGDAGPGIPENMQTDIFRPFFTTREKGTGLGLSIVRRLVEANGGTIRLVPSHSEGAQFEINFVRTRTG
jgi:signal transduction histidine kinase